MSDPEEIKISVMGEVVTILDHGDGLFVVKPSGGGTGWDTPQRKIRQLAEAYALQTVATVCEQITGSEITPLNHSLSPIPRQKYLSYGYQTYNLYKSKDIFDVYDAHQFLLRGIGDSVNNMGGAPRD